MDGLVPCGSTGESATLSHEEHERVIDFTLEKANKRVKVIAGAGSSGEASRVWRGSPNHSLMDCSWPP